MNEFMEALISKRRNTLIPEEKDYFGSLVGEWDFDWTDRIGTKEERHVKGEWIFSRILDGMGIQDVFICPSRKERRTRHEPDEEYGTTLRIYNPATGNWEICYCCPGEYTRLEAVKEADKIVLTEKEHGRMKWIFSEIEENSFHWQNVTLGEDGGWGVCCDCRAARRR
jgi:hypothetical protein